MSNGMLKVRCHTAMVLVERIAVHENQGRTVLLQLLHLLGAEFSNGNDAVNLF